MKPAAEEQFERIRMTAGLFAGPAVFLLVLLLPAKGISPAAHRLLAIVSLVVVFWVTEAIPIAATALLGSAAAVVMGVAPAKEVFAPYSDPIIFLFIGSFIIARSMSLHGLDRRFAAFVLRRRSVSRSFWRMIFALGMICAALSMWMSNTAVAAMMIPFAVCFLKPFHEEGKRRTFLLGCGGLTVAYSCSIGGIATPIGTPPNLITLALLDKSSGIRIPFFQWMVIGVPLGAAMIAVLMLVLWLKQRKTRAPGDAVDMIACIKPRARRMSAGERNTLVVFSSVVALWMVPGLLGVIGGTESSAYGIYRSRLPEAVVAIAGAILLFVLPVNFKEKKFTIAWNEAARINWGTIFLFGGGLSLGTLMFRTGLGEAIGEAILGVTGRVDLFTLTFIAIIGGMVLTEFTSNTAATNIVIPVVISIAGALGVQPLPPVLGACFGASMAFMLPISTPPNAIAYSTGCIRITSMLSTGVILDAAAVLVILFALKIYMLAGLI